MTNERLIRLLAGGFILTSLGLALTVSRNWLWMTAFVGANLAQSAFTNFCPLEKILQLRRETAQK